MSSTETRKDVYTRVTAQIISNLEQGVCTWMKPWHTEYAAGRITRPLPLQHPLPTPPPEAGLWSTRTASAVTAGGEGRLHPRSINLLDFSDCHLPRGFR